MFNVFRKSTFFLVFTFFSVVTVATNAQTTRPPVSVSLQGGLSLATLSPEIGSDASGVDYSYTNGFHVRASVFLPFSRLLGAQLGVGWVLKGSSLSFPVPENLDDFPDLSGWNFSSKVSTGYLQFPLLLSLKPTPVLYILVGPVVSIPLSCSVKSFGASADCRGGLRELNTDISIMAGIGASIPLSSSFSLLLDAVYDLGTTGTTKDSISKNRGFLFTTGIRLPLNQ